jgi:hypothetical protein
MFLTTTRMTASLRHRNGPAGRRQQRGRRTAVSANGRKAAPPACVSRRTSDHHGPLHADRRPDTGSRRGVLLDRRQGSSGRACCPGPAVYAQQQPGAARPQRARCALSSVRI